MGGDKARHCLQNTGDRGRKKEADSKYISVGENPFRTFRREEREHKAAVCFISGQSSETAALDCFHVSQYVSRLQW